MACIKKLFNNVLKCWVCGSTDVTWDPSEQEMTCRDCGYVW